MTYDEGVYLASLRALREGETLAEDVFASQPPGFYLLLRSAALVFGAELDDIRLAFVVIASLGCLAAYALARAMAGRAAGAIATLLLAVSPPYLENAAVVAADIPSASFALIGVTIADRAWRRAGSTSRAISLSVVSGLIFMAAISVKLSALLALAAFGALALLLRPPARCVIAWMAGGIAVVGALAVAHWRTLDAIWQDAVTFHRDARGVIGPWPRDTFENIGKIGASWPVGAAVLWLAVLGALATIGEVARRRLPSPLWAWPLATVAFLLWHRPLFAHHVVLLLVAFAVPVGVALAAAASSHRLRRASSACLATGLAIAVVQACLSATGAPSAEPAERVAAAAIVRDAAAPDELVVTDVPSVAVLADRRIPGELVDMSRVRVASGDLTASEILDIVDATRTPVAAIGRALSSDAGFAAELEVRFPSRTRVGYFVVYLR